MSQEEFLLLMAVGVAVGVRSADEPIWRTSSRCESGACVEVGIRGEIVIVRRSQDPEGVSVTLVREMWQEFLARVRDGGFDSS